MSPSANPEQPRLTYQSSTTHESNTEYPPFLVAVNATNQVHVIIGANSLAAARCMRSLQVGAKPIVIFPETTDAHYSLMEHVANGSVQWVKREFEEDDLKRFGREEVDLVVDAVFVTLGPNHPLSSRVSHLCRRLRIPVNVTNAPDLCSFALLSTHSDGPLHIGITTSGRGCKLASRLRREIVSSLPANFGNTVNRLGMLRRRLREEDHGIGKPLGKCADDEDDSTSQSHTFNELVASGDSEATKTRRIRWLSQICEYWPLRKLATISDADVDAILTPYSTQTPSIESHIEEMVGEAQRTSTITLAGSGPGHPDLLTRATYKAIKNADIILADKLVPEPVLELIPRGIEVHIARKFPGNAEQAQEEFLQMGLQALRAGRHVLRLKQGDPYLYGRGAEEYEFFRSHGFEPVVLPGITSALSAPLFADIPTTHRGVSDQVLICTGTGRKGAAPEPPTCQPTQTVVFLMALHRLPSLIESLVIAPTHGEKTSRTPWPTNTPCAVIERASCPDQRIIRTTLEYVCLAVEQEGSRPPGLLVVGNSCQVLHGNKGQKWIVEDGFRRLDKLGDESELIAISRSF